MKTRESTTAYSALCLLIAMIASSPTVFAQQAIAPDTVTFLGHVVSMAPLVASGNAGSSHVQGTVVLSVEVGTDGSVISAKAVSGPAELVPAAVNCAKQWKFRPFEKDGKKVPADGELSFRFGQGSVGQQVAAKDASTASAKPETGSVKNKVPASSPDGGSAANFDSLWKQCSDAMIHHMPGAETASVCKKAADLAATFPPDKMYLQKRSAFVYAATAFANAGDFKDGEIYAQKAVAAAERDRHKKPGDGEVYSTLGHIEAMEGDFVDADGTMTTAEDYDRKSIAWARKKEAAWGPAYVEALQADLRFHALVLKDMKRKHEAKKKLEEAAKLSQ
jgi:Gram-negative bacterial TonB protein C-terminal